jgi:hypothetical protein
VYERHGEIRAILEYFICMIGNTAEAWSYCSVRSDGHMLQACSSCSLSVLSERFVDIKL